MDGRAFLEVNPQGLVPTLQLDHGMVLTENLAILAYRTTVGPTDGRRVPAVAQALAAEGLA
jgi:glutathione S-transferase